MSPRPLTPIHRLLQKHIRYRLLANRDQTTQACTSGIRPFTTRSRLRSDQANGTPNGSHKAQGGFTPSPRNPEYPAFSLKDLGANRASKTVVLIALSVLATMESVFWIKVGWRRFGLSTEEKVSTDGKEG